jgi:hypothetical protein
MGRKPTNDPNLFAKRVFDNLLDKLDPEAAAERKPEPEPEGKDPKAVQAGHLGGLKGGRARAAALTPRKRRQIAKKAAKARWEKP